MTEPGDLSLARQAASGDAAAFTAIVEATHNDVWRACAHLVDRQSADDLTQQTYLRALDALTGYTAAASLRGWLLGIARHICADELRARQRRRRLHRDLPPPPANTDPTAVVDLLLALADLPRAQREAFVLTQIVGLDYNQTAEACRCPVGTIRSRVARARHQLVAILTTTNPEHGRGEQHHRAAGDH